MNITERKQSLQDQIAEISTKVSQWRKNDFWLFPICVISICIGVYFGSWVAWIIAAVSFLCGEGEEPFNEYRKVENLKIRLDELHELESA